MKTKYVRKSRAQSPENLIALYRNSIFQFYFKSPPLEAQRLTSACEKLHPTRKKLSKKCPLKKRKTQKTRRQQKKVGGVRKIKKAEESWHEKQNWPMVKLEKGPRKGLHAHF